MDSLSDIQFDTNEPCFLLNRLSSVRLDYRNTLSNCWQEYSWADLTIPRLYLDYNPKIKVKGGKITKTHHFYGLSCYIPLWTVCFITGLIVIATGQFTADS